MQRKLPEELLDLPETPVMPVLFIGHGNPMNAIEENFYTNEWKKIASGLTVPKAILCISAHWLTKGTWVTAMEKPRTIHDFYGFPKELFAVNYPATGAPQFAEFTKSLVKKTEIGLDHDWGLDHGTWSVLNQMFPSADIPVYQLSIDYHKPANYHYELAGELKKLRAKGVLIIGSGNIVHNLRIMRFEDLSYDWTIEFDAMAKNFIWTRDDEALIDYEKHGEIAKLSIPTPDHFFPLLYTLGVTERNEIINFFSEKTTMGSISMRSVLIKKKAELIF
ncbi:MAG TPA: 4,5-DOPA dioxygenase extradiol [Cyclobacteriaceae bacterium]